MAGAGSRAFTSLLTRKCLASPAAELEGNAYITSLTVISAAKAITPPGLMIGFVWAHARVEADGRVATIARRRRALAGMIWARCELTAMTFTRENAAGTNREDAAASMNGR